MLELPETLTLARQLNAAIAGKSVSRVLPPTKEHKFCWYNGDPASYNDTLANHSFCAASGFGIFAEMTFDNGYRLCVNDGVNVRLVSHEDMPRGYQLAMCFEGGDALVFTVAMYGGIFLHDGGYDNEYYIKSREFVSPFAPEFDMHYREILAKSKPTLSAKAFVATEQRFPGIGNGTAQDILFGAGINPKRKLSTLSTADTDRLLASMKTTLRAMTDFGGRDTEKDLYGNAGGYVTKLSKNTLANGCPVCAGAITKENYLGGSVYYCAHCQPL